MGNGEPCADRTPAAGAVTGGNAIADIDGRLSAATAKADHMAPERLGYVHYAISVVDFYVFFAGYRTGGLPPKPGDHLAIGYGCGTSTDDFEVGAILTHELGHNADLDHGGHEARNGKPNYQSLMNDAFAYGADLDCNGEGDTPRQLRWSGEVLPTLDEFDLYEANGVCGDTPADLDGDGVIEPYPLRLDLNGDGTDTVLEGSDDGEHLDLARSFPRNRAGRPNGEEVYDPLP